MSEKQKTLEYDLDGKTIQIITQRANARMGVHRFRMMIDAEEFNKTDKDEDLKPLRMFTFPDIVCGTLEVKGMPWPISFDDFVELPEDLVDQWSRTVYAVNPPWRATGLEVAPDPKK